MSALIAVLTVLQQSAYAVGPVTVTGVSPSSGPAAGGITVAITGSDFTGATAVTFGSDPASSFTVVDDNDITAVSPQTEAGTFDVLVTGPDGSSTAIAADQYTPVPGPPGAPQNIQAVATEPKTVQLTWQPPVFDGGSPIVSYLIQPSRQSVLKATMPSSFCSSVTCTELLSGFNAGSLTLTVYAISQAGFSGSAASVNANVWAMRHVKLPSQRPLQVIAGQPVDVQLIAATNDGSPLYFSLTPPLPPGLSLDPTTGVVSGTIIEPNLNHRVSLGPRQLVVSNPFVVSRTINLGGTITPSLKAPVQPFQRTRVNTPAIPYQFAATDILPGAVLNYSAIGLAPGLTIDPNLGVITGTPTAVGPFRATVTVTDNFGQVVTRGLSWAVTIH